MIANKKWFYWGKILLLIVLPITLYCLLLSFPIPRQIGLTFRYGFTTTVILLLVLFGFTYWISGWKGTLLGLCATVFVFAMPLSGLWSSGQSEQYILGGLLPFSDGMNYHADAQRLLEGMSFTSFSARRPLFPAFFVFVMSLTKQNLQVSLAVLVALTAFACYLATREIQNSYGIGAGIFFIIVLFLFYRPLIGKVLTEHIGLIFSALGFTLLWRGAVSKNAWIIFTGLFFVSYALNARAGAFFVLPALILWSVWLYKENKKSLFSALGWSIAAVMLGFVVNYLLFKSLVGYGTMFSNFSTTIYGLVSGGNSWTYVYGVYPEIWSMDEPELAKTVYGYAFELFKSNPLLTVIGALKSWREFFSLQWYSAFCFIGGDQPWLQIVSRSAMYGLCILGIIKWWKNKNDARSMLIIFTLIGIFVSIPFVPPMDTNRMRAHAAIIPFFIALPTMGVIYLLQIFKLRIFTNIKWEHQSTLLPMLYGLSIITITIIGSLIIKSTTVKLNEQAIQCPQDEKGVMVRISPGSFIRTVENHAVSQDWLPKIRINRFLLSAHNLPNWEYYPILDKIKADTLIANTINLDNGDFILLIDANDLIPDAGGVFGLCGEVDVNIVTIYYPRSVVYYAVN